MSTPLLATKLYTPPLRPNLVPRPRLVERLDAGLHRKCTLVSAPAGYGKTTLLSEWLDGLTTKHVEPYVTVVTGPVAGQAALYGLCGKLRDLGLPLLAVNPVPEVAHA